MNGIISKRSAASILGVVAMTVAVSGCNSDAASSSAPTVSGVESTPQDWYPGERPILRSQTDAVRGRLWALTSEGVELYDATTRQRVAQIALPGWLWVSDQYSCPPDLAIGPGGEAIISSNVVSTLWRIDPVTLAARKHEPVLDVDTGKDVGFTGLAYSAQQGAYFAVSGIHGSMWRIDRFLEKARSVPLSAPLPKACRLAIPRREIDQRASGVVGFCVRSELGDWTVNLAPDQRSGYTRPGQCMI